MKEKGYNDFPPINTSFKFSQINHSPLVIIRTIATSVVKNTVSLTYGSLQVLSRNYDTTIEKWMAAINAIK